MRLAPTLLSLAITAVLTGAASAAPDEERLGKVAGYPLGTARTWHRDEGVRVGSFSNLDRILPHNVLAKAAMPSPLVPATETFQATYGFDGKQLTISDFLARQRVTGLLIVKDGQVLAERYQYDRTASHRFVSNSIAKSVTSLAIGLAVQDKLIASLDDVAAKYEPQLAGSAYGDTSVRDLLRMSSGVKFREVYDGADDIKKFEVLRAREGTIAASRAFSEREAKAGERFSYASSESAVLAVVLKAATGRTLAAYLTERLWQPLGAEAEATWVKSADALEKGGWGFNAVLRDYARLGLLLANDGAVDGRQILPKDYLLEATDWRKQPEAFAPRKATPYFGYGYQFWTFPGEQRRFALLGVYGQSIFVDPSLKLVLVITAAARNASVGKESLAAERNALWRGLVAKYGSW